MAESHVRQALDQHYSGLDFSSGLKQAWHSKQPDRRSQAFPYQSLRQLLHALRWPAQSSFRQLDEHPTKRRTAWSDEVQGVSHAQTHWFISNQNRDNPSDHTENKLWRIPVSLDLDQDFHPTPPAVMVRRMPNELSGYDHFGDLDVYNGNVYMAVEGAPKPGIIAQFGAETLDFRGSGVMSAQGTSAPWCAVHPQTGHLYSSRFDEVTKVHIYQPIHNGEGKLQALEHLGDLRLWSRNGNPYTIRSVQGGTVSPSGHLYLVSDQHDGGILGFDTMSGEIRIHIDIAYLRGFSEYEGITYWDLTSQHAPGIGGVLHMLEMRKRNLLDDLVIFRHFDVDRADRNFV